MIDLTLLHSEEALTEVAETFQVPFSIVEGLKRYCHKCIPGSFLLAVLRNDLYQAAASADSQNRYKLKEIVCLIHNVLPGDIYGSREAVEKHLKEL